MEVALFHHYTDQHDCFQKHYMIFTYQCSYSAYIQLRILHTEKKKITLVMPAKRLLD